MKPIKYAKQASFLSAVVAICGCLYMSEPNNATAISSGRHFELVSPTYKGGYGVDFLRGAAIAGSKEGEGVVFNSRGSFAGESVGGLTSSYISLRSPTGWVTTALQAPMSVATSSGINEISPTLIGLYTGASGQSTVAAEMLDPKPRFLVHDLASANVPTNFIGFPIERLDGKPLFLSGATGASADFCHIVFEVANTFTAGINEEPLLLEGINTNSVLYDLSTGLPGCTSSHALRLVGVSNQLGPHKEPAVIDRYCVPYLGANTSEGNKFNAVADDGEEIFFTMSASTNEPKCDGETIVENNPSILFMRVGGQRTIEISKPIAADCTSGPCVSSTRRRAEFVGADQAGTRAFFLTKQPLVTDDTNQEEDLYLANIGCPNVGQTCTVSQREVTSLTQVSKAIDTSQAAEVQGVVLATSDGQRIYFVAHGVLATNHSSEGEYPRLGADNLYVYDVVEKTTNFVAELCSGSQLSGSVTDRECPNGSITDAGLWGEVKEAQATNDGRFFVFSTYARLTPDDTDATKDVYRYDAVKGLLSRISVGEDGYSANGNTNGFNAGIPRLQDNGSPDTDYEIADRAISEDGSRIVFETAEPLSPNAVNGLTNAYEWREGASEDNQGDVLLVSNGSDEEPVGERNGSLGEIVITPSGRDIFFMTAQSLAAGDKDGAVDIYDARSGQGFATAQSEAIHCAGESCRGPLSTPVPFSIPLSVLQKPERSLPRHKKKTRKRGAKRHRRKPNKPELNRSKSRRSTASRRRHTG